MKFNVYDIERECTIVSAPKGVFCTAEEGLYWFPIYFVFAPSITEDEKSCGDVLICPISGFNDGMESLSTNSFWDCLTYPIFEKLVREGFGVYYDNVEELARVIIDDMKVHNIPFHQLLQERLKDKDYFSKIL